LSPQLTDRFIVGIAGRKEEANLEDNLIGKTQNRPLWGGFVSIFYSNNFTK
jgi:hypothetical protein